MLRRFEVSVSLRSAQYRGPPDLVGRLVLWSIKSAGSVGAEQTSPGRFAPRLVRERCRAPKFESSINLPYKVGPQSAFFFRQGYVCGFSGFQVAEHPCHVFGKDAHGLKAFFVFFDVFRTGTVYHVPVLGTDHGHVGNGEIFVQTVQCGTGACTTAGYHGCGKFSAHETASAVKETVKKGTELSGRTGIVDRGTDNHSVVLFHVCKYFVYFVVEDTGTGGSAFSAGNASGNRLFVEVEDVGGDFVLG